jgi:hypothetical protein
MICKICNAEMRAITNTHLVKHGISTSEYVAKYGQLSEPRRNDELLARLSLFGIGTLPDSVVAQKSGVSRRGIAHYRKQLGLPTVSVIYRTQEGYPCRSILEAKYDAWLHDNDIEHLHEQEVPGIKGKCRADFRVGNTFVEIAGMIGYKKYALRWAKKCELYTSAGVEWKAVYEEEVERVYASCKTEVIFVKRCCAKCGEAIKVSLDGMCRKCHRKAWGQKNATLVDCDYCGKKYSRTAGSELGKFCTRKCYWNSLRNSHLPSDEDLAMELQGATAPILAEKYGVKANTINKRVWRARQRAS